MATPELSQQMIDEGMARAEKVACRPDDDRCYPFPDPLALARASCTRNTGVGTDPQRTPTPAQAHRAPFGRPPAERSAPRYPSAVLYLQEHHCCPSAGVIANSRTSASRI